ncbi:MAG: hypothetical protein U9N02_05835 [Campylobacterota bacterium]|nr:hypothetical protein [Campylobacterota bacterium]
MSISTNLSSIQSHQTMLGTNANNVANANTDGFIPSDTRMSSGAGSSITASNRQADDTGSPKSQTNLTKEIPNQIIAEDAVGVNVASIKTQDQMLGTLLDMKV